ncbi:MAG: hypothetical protein QOJ15_2859 [Bradyrhizobium sp.]|jgi:hypothetical protein|nr:hypothetical protein [Bradyrhizobium sp.]
MLVRRRNRAAADAGRWRGLPVPGLFEEGCKLVAARKTLTLKSRASRGVSKDGTAHIVSILRDARKSALLSR